MEIEITMQEPVSDNTISNEPNNSDITTTDIVNESRDSVGITAEPLEIPKKVLSKKILSKKILSNEGMNAIIDNVIDNVINDVGDYLTENTEFAHMKDEIINKRMRVIMKEKIYEKIHKNILEFGEFLAEDKYIQEHIEINNKVIYDVRCLDDINLYMYNYIYDYLYNHLYSSSHNDYITLAEGWLIWNEKKGKFYNVDINLKDFIIQKIVKYVFQQLGDDYEFIDEQTNSPDCNENTNANEEEQNNNSDGDDSDDGSDGNDSNDDSNDGSDGENEFNKNKQNNECVIN